VTSEVSTCFGVTANFAFLRDFGNIRPMALDPLHPPIWLRKLHVSAQQISSDDYAQTPEEGILLTCQLSDAHLALAEAFVSSLFPNASPGSPSHQRDATR
jgi:hypothetical protein